MRRAFLASLILAASAPVAAREPADVLMPVDPAALARRNRQGYADAVIAGDMVYLSGVVAGLKPGETDMQPAFDRAFARIGETLGRAGVSWDDVVEMTTYHTDLRGQLDAFAAVKNRYVVAPFPAWTAIGTTGLADPAGIAEIKVVARKPRR